MPNAGLQRIRISCRTQACRDLKTYLWGYVFVTFLYNTAIAGLITLIQSEWGFWNNFIISQCVGFSIATLNTLVLAPMQPGKKRWLTLCATLPVSIVIGITIALWITGMGDWSHPYVLPTVFVGLFFGIIATIIALLSEHIENLANEVKQREINLVESEKRQVEAQLKMLQAQIEPHFLFNTLANVGSLIDTDPVLAKKLLERLNDWLRIALQRTRSEQATLGDELEMLENYLQILKVRFGQRLHWDTEVAGEVRAVAFPPMLLQPLVENAVRHGIEPKIGGGVIHIGARLSDTSLRVEVTDSGVGLLSQEGSGAGLANVRARLAALFGEGGRLVLESNAGGGVTAVLELPR
jgi:sensor histidine kinase YesM